MSKNSMEISFSGRKRIDAHSGKFEIRTDQSVKNGGEELQIHPPFYIYTEKNGPYTDQMQELYS